MWMFALTFQFGLATEFVAASVPKFWHRSEFRDAVANYQLLPAQTVGPVAAALPWAELSAAVGLFIGSLGPYVAGLAASMLVIYATAVAVSLIRGRRISCGCRPGVASRNVSWYLVFKDVLLAACASFVAFRGPLFAIAGTGGLRSVPNSASTADALASALVATSSLLAAAIVSDGWGVFAVHRRLSTRKGVAR